MAVKGLTRPSIPPSLLPSSHSFPSSICPKGMARSTTRPINQLLIKPINARITGHLPYSSIRLTACHREEDQWCLHNNTGTQTRPQEDTPHCFPCPIIAGGKVKNGSCSNRGSGAIGKDRRCRCIYAAGWGGGRRGGGGWMDGGRIRHNAVQNLEINPPEYAATLSLLLHHSCFNLRERLDWLSIFALCQTVP